MYRKSLIISLLGLWCCAALGAQTKPRLAILPFTGGNGGDGETIAMLLANQGDIRNNFTPVPRTSNVNVIMREQRFQRSGLTDSDTIAQLGKQMNAEFVVAGHISKLGTRNLVLISIVNVESFQQIAGDYREYGEIGEMRALLPDMARKLVSASQQTGGNLPKLAVLPFNIPAGVNQGDAEALAQLLATEIANRGKYVMLPRTTTIEQVMVEQRTQRSGLTDPESIKRIGAATNAQYVLAGDVRRLGANLNLFIAQILHIETGVLLKGGDVEYAAIGDGLILMPELAEKLSGREAPEGFALVEGGTFPMGSANGRDNEKPVHRVTVRSFYMAKYPVTQKEWLEVMGTTIRQQRDMADKGWAIVGERDTYPMYYVSWQEAVEYCNQRSIKEGLTPAYRGSGDSITCDWSATGYRLPTEAEWEYAAKGGNKDYMVYEYSGSNSIDSVAWYRENSGRSTHPVGTKTPNSLGIYDMNGNVWEWCWDRYDSYSGDSRPDPRGPLGPASSGSGRVVRGGSWSDSAAYARSAYRADALPSYRGYDLGFRLVLRP